jgi:hypothetical protein
MTRITDPWAPSARRRRRPRAVASPVHSPRRAMTLLEVMLALTLTAVVLVAISMAIDIHLRLLDSRRGQVEHMQLARGVLHIIAGDLRASVQQYSTDFSGVSAMVSDAVSGGADLGALVGDAAAAGGGGGGGGGGSLAGDSGGSGALSGLDDMSEGLTGASQDIAQTTMVPAVPGLYGNQFELQIDISRVPRVDEYEHMVNASAINALQDIPSDVKTVAYYCLNTDNLPVAGFQRGLGPAATSGLVRRVLDRAVTLYAADSGNVIGLQQVGDVIAPEVLGIEFEYFDGTNWLYEWDSELMGGLPLAVRIALMVATPERAETSDSWLNFRASSTPSPTYQVYSLVVRIPTAKPIPLDSTAESSGLEAVGL